MLDFDIYSDTDRTKAVYEELDSLKKPPTQSQLDTMANYILYGKDKNGLNAVDRGEVEIQTKFSSYAKRKAESLDELMESPVFSETQLQPLRRSPYKNPKPELDRSLPDLQPLLETIEQQESVVQDLESLPQTPEIKTRLYKLKHLIIALKKEQYSLQEEVRPALQLMSYNQPYYDPYNDNLCENIGPLGLKVGNLARFCAPRDDHTNNTVETFYDPSKEGIDLENPIHIYQILEIYEQLYERSIDNPYVNAKYLVETIDWLIDQVQFDESRVDIIRMKKAHKSNNVIRAALHEKYGYNYSENYISTIYTKEICKKIAAQMGLVRERWESRKNPSVWKKCSCCGEWKLKDAREFVRRKNSEDGFTSRCKVCDKKKKLEKKKQSK